MSKPMPRRVPIEEYWKELAFPKGEFPHGPPKGAHSGPEPFSESEEIYWKADTAAHEEKWKWFVERELQAWDEIKHRALAGSIDVFAFERIVGAPVGSWYNRDAYSPARVRISPDFFLEPTKLSPYNPPVIYYDNPFNAPWLDPVVVERTDTVAWTVPPLTDRKPSAASLSRALRGLRAEAKRLGILEPTGEELERLLTDSHNASRQQVRDALEDVLGSASVDRKRGRRGPQNPKRSDELELFRRFLASAE